MRVLLAGLICARSGSPAVLLLESQSWALGTVRPRGPRSLCDVAPSPLLFQASWVSTLASGHNLHSDGLRTIARPHASPNTHARSWTCKCSHLPLTIWLHMYSTCSHSRSIMLYMDSCLFLLEILASYPGFWFLSLCTELRSSVSF